MQAVDRRSLERASKVAQVIAEHPDLPMICLAPSTPCDFDSYYHDVCGASVKKLLFPSEVQKLYGDSYYLDLDRTYDDMDEVEEECYDWLWDNCGRDIVGHAPKPVCLNDIHEVRAMDTFAKRYGHIARMMAEDMPWHEYIVIDCY